MEFCEVVRGDCGRMRRSLASERGRVGSSSSCSLYVTSRRGDEEEGRAKERRGRESDSWSKQASSGESARERERRRDRERKRLKMAQGVLVAAT